MRKEEKHEGENVERFKKKRREGRDRCKKRRKSTAPKIKINLLPQK